MTSHKRILYIQYTNPACYPLLESSALILQREGWEVLFLGVHVPGVENIRFCENKNINFKYLFVSEPHRQKWQYALFMLWVFFWVLKWHPAWIYASDPATCPITLLLSYLPGQGVLYHEHDSPTPGAPVASPIRKICLWARRKLSRRATACLLPNEAREKHFRLDVEKPVNTLCVWNCPRREEAAILSENKKTAGLRVIYHGSIVPERLPGAVLEAFARLPGDITLQVIGYETMGSRGYVEKLKKLARELRIEERITFLGTLERHQQILDCCRLSHAGFALMPLKSTDINMQHMIGASSKVFQYLACGLPVIVSDLPDWREAYVKPGYGLSCDPSDPDSIAKAIRWLFEHPLEARQMGENGRQKILREWNYETQFQPVMRLLRGETAG